MSEVEWARLKAHELRLRAKDNAVVILPVASIEQHGPHLPVMTDTRIGHEVACRAARKAYDRQPTIVTPVVWHGLSALAELRSRPDGNLKRPVATDMPSSL